MEVVRVTPVDWQRVRDMRLRALLDAPDVDAVGGWTRDLGIARIVLRVTEGTPLQQHG
jgi:hypothetical protein